MNRTIMLVIWNVLLTAALGWLLLRGGTASPEVAAVEPADGVDTLVTAPRMATDTAALKDARIAFFFMDSIQSGYDMVKESSNRVKNFGQSVDADLKNRFRATAEKIRALEEKDQRYTTVAEQQEDQRQYEALQRTMQELQAEQDRKQQDFDEMQIKALQDITLEIQNFLEEYNKTRHFDYIFSIQDGGQVWVGNEGLDISGDVVDGLNARHRAKKAAPPASPAGGK